MARPTAATVKEAEANSRTIILAAFETVKEQFASAKGWMGVRNVNILSDEGKVVDTYLVKFRKDRAELFKATGEYLPLQTSVRVGKLATAE